MKSNAMPKVYHSFEEFERDELYRLDSMTMSIDQMLDDMFGEPTAMFDTNTDESNPLGDRKAVKNTKRNGGSK